MNIVCVSKLTDSTKKILHDYLKRTQDPNSIDLFIFHKITYHPLVIVDRKEFCSFIDCRFYDHSIDRSSDKIFEDFYGIQLYDRVHTLQQPYLRTLNSLFLDTSHLKLIDSGHQFPISDFHHQTFTFGIFVDLHLSIESWLRTKRNKYRMGEWRRPPLPPPPSSSDVRIFIPEYLLGVNIEKLFYENQIVSHTSRISFDKFITIKCLFIKISSLPIDQRRHLYYFLKYYPDESAVRQFPDRRLSSQEMIQYKLKHYCSNNYFTNNFFLIFKNDKIFIVREPDILFMEVKFIDRFKLSEILNIPLQSLRDPHQEQQNQHRQRLEMSNEERSTIKFEEQELNHYLKNNLIRDIYDIKKRLSKLENQLKSRDMLEISGGSEILPWN